MNRIGPKLTLGIPVYNGAAYLAQLFDCLRTQTFIDYEAIISDNASTDGDRADLPADDRRRRALPVRAQRRQHRRGAQLQPRVRAGHGALLQMDGARRPAGADLPRALRRGPGRRSERLRLPRRDSGRQRGVAAAQLRFRPRPLRGRRRHAGAAARAAGNSQPPPTPPGASTTCCTACGCARRSSA